jgi:DNA repair protein RadC
MRRTTKPRDLAETAPLFDLPPQLAGVSTSGTEGHRARMRERLLQHGPNGLLDHEMLEMILFLALPRRDTKPIAKALLARFSTFPAAVAAPLNDLLQIEGLGEAGAAALKIVQAGALRLARGAIATKPLLDQWQKVVDYLKTVLAHEKTEQCRVLYLDAKNRLLADESQGRGTVNHTPVYPREVVRRALELHATALVLAHNHPSGDPRPSRDDIALTQDIVVCAQQFGIIVHDHLIIAGETSLSFRQQGLL